MVGLSLIVVPPHLVEQWYMMFQEHVDKDVCDIAVGKGLDGTGGKQWLIAGSQDLTKKGVACIKQRITERGGVLARIFVDEAQDLGPCGVYGTNTKTVHGKQLVKTLKKLVDDHECPIHFISATPLSTSKGTDVDNMFTFLQVMGFHPFTPTRGKRQLWKDIRTGLPQEVLERCPNDLI